MRIPLDQNSPKGLATLPTGHEVSRAAPMGWAELDNGELLAVAEAAEFDLMITEQAGKKGYAELNLPRPPLKRGPRPSPC